MAKTTKKGSPKVLELPKFNIGDSVVYVDSEFKAIRTTISAIDYSFDGINQLIYYKLGCGTARMQQDLFSNVGEAREDFRRHFAKLLAKIK